MDPNTNRRVLVVDDNRSVQEDFRKILGGASHGSTELDSLAGDLFGEGGTRRSVSYDLTVAGQGQEALELVQAAVESDRPFAVAFVDVRMPPGWDGIETIRRLWEVDPDLQCVVCTAYSDYSYEETVAVLGESERFLILKKPFDPIEVQQLAASLTSKWTTARKEREHFEELRAYAASLETVNRALHADKATAQAWAESKTDFVVGAARSIARPLASLAAEAERAAAEAGVEPLREALLASAGSGRAVRRTLEQLAELTELESGRLRLVRERVDLDVLLQRVRDGVQAVAEEHGATADLRTQAPLPDTLQLDVDRTVACLADLVRGGLERLGSERVRVEINLDTTQDGTGLGPLRFDVVLTGEPLDREREAEFFCAYPTAPEPTDDGLDWPHARQLAQQLGGGVQLEPGGSSGVRLALRLEGCVPEGAQLVDPQDRRRPRAA